MQKCIYIIFSHTNTKMGKTIRFFTRYSFSHVSISLNETLQPMYSFSRYYINEPFSGGFTEESLKRYTYNGEDFCAEVFRIPIKNEEYDQIENYLKALSAKKHEYRYDLMGALGFRKKAVRKRTYTCIAFVNQILVSHGILNKSCYSIKELYENLAGFETYEFHVSPEEVQDASWGEDEYGNSTGAFSGIKHLCLNTKELAKRYLTKRL